jgi:putative transposase
MSYAYTQNSTYFITYKTFHALNFFESDRNKEILKQQLYKSSEKYNFEMIAYAILSNHYHLLIQMNDSSQMNQAIQLINGGSSYLIEKPKYSKHVWERTNKYSSAIYDEKGKYQVLGYITGNPLKHGIIKDFNELEQHKYCNYSEAKELHGKDLVNNLILKNCKFNFESPESFERVYATL